MWDPIALVESGRFIEISVKKRSLNIVGIHGKRTPLDLVDKILKERKEKWSPRTPKYQKGVLALYTQHAVSPMKGGYME